MTPQEYARVKEVFNAAIELPSSKRFTHVRAQCSDSPTVMNEVISLLQHHRDDTILEAQAYELPTHVAAEPATQESIAASQSRGNMRADGKRAYVQPPSVDPYLVQDEVWNANREILRRRLIIIACVLAGLVAYSLIRMPLANQYLVWGYGARIVALAISLACAWTLNHYRELSLRAIQIAEFVVMANIGMLAGVIYLRLLLVAAASQDAGTLISISNWNQFIWALLILVYAVFMPNTWRRALAVTLPLAFVPSLIVAVANRIDPQVLVLLAQDKFGRPIPAPAVAVCVSVYAAHIIHGARLSAFQARRLAQYRLGEMIGEGAMGQVFKAEHLLLKRSCAIKLIQPEHCADSQAMQRFEREVRATAKLTHPHTVEVYDFGQTKDQIFFFAMELLPGINLQQMVRRFGPLPPARVVHFMKQICGALQEAHDVGLIHRDVKPANIFASSRGGIQDFAKLLDFGVVAEVDIDTASHDSSRKVVGTPLYMSPEQIVTPGKVDGRSDLYAVGAVAYFLLTGSPPLMGDTLMEIIHAQVNQQPRPPSDLETGIPTDVEMVVMRCLAKDANERFQNATLLTQAFSLCRCANDWSQQEAAKWWSQRTNGSQRSAKEDGCAAL